MTLPAKKWYKVHYFEWSLMVEPWGIYLFKIKELFKSFSFTHFHSFFITEILEKKMKLNRKAQTYGDLVLFSSHFYFIFKDQLKIHFE